jgi:hypothetical protein
MSDQSRRLFHAVVVFGSAMAVPAIAVGASAVAAISIPGCGDDGSMVGIAVDIGVPRDMSFVVDIGIPPFDIAPFDLAHD